MSVCSACGELAVFVDGPFGMTLVKPSPADLAEFAVDPGVRAMLAAAAEVRVGPGDAPARAARAVARAAELEGQS